MATKTDSVLTPRLSGEYVAKRARNVHINNRGVDRASKLVFEAFAKGDDPSNWRDHPLHAAVSDTHAVDWIFLVDSLNFCFWPDEGCQKYQVELDGQLHSGYFSLCAALNRAIRKNPEIVKPKYYQNITLDECRQIFESSDKSVEIPLLEMRHKIMNECGKKLVEDFNGSFVNCVRKAKGDATELLNIVVSNFPSFKDEADYFGQKVAIYKRAQILIADLHSYYEDTESAFQNVSELTMFADYRVPQVLHYLGALQYTPTLMNRIKNKELIPNGDPDEVEIRCCSINCVELILESVESINKEKSSNEKLRENVDAAKIDYFLWTYRRRFANQIERQIDFHRTRCIYY